MVRTAHAIVLCVCVVLAGSAFAIEPNAFLEAPAFTTQQLLDQVKSNRVVADRYMRHFAMTRSEVLTYLATLKPSRLKQAGDYVVYNCLPSGKIRSRTFHMKAGTSVWVDRNGRPVLKMSCGNPMTWKVPWVPEPTTAPEVDAPMSVTEASPLQPEVVDATMRPVEMEAIAPDQVAMLVPDVDIPTVGVIPETVTETVTPVPSVIPGPPSFGWILPFALIVPITQGGGGEPPIPEPSMLVGGAVVLGGLALRAARRR